MQPRPRKRSRLQFQPPFLAGALGALSLAGGGCGALVEDGAAGDGSGGSEAQDGAGGPGCPAVAPPIGSACTTPGYVCVKATCNETGVFCGTNGTWQKNYMSCNPPPSGCVWEEGGMSCKPPPPTYVCPSDPPTIGSACASPGTVCVEATCDDTGLVCGADSTWEETYMFCNPPTIGYGGLGGEAGQP